MAADARYIDTFDELTAWCNRLVHAQEVAIDTESDSFFCYREKTCLIQMTAFDEDVIIDPLVIGDLSPLAAVLADASCPKILHDAGYDLVCLQRDFGFELRNVFDTMLASRLLGARHFGLAALLKEHFAFQADKRYQRSDWSRRPLSAGQLAYARYDTHFLPALRALLTKQLAERGRLTWAQEEFARLPLQADKLRAPRAENQALGFWRVAGAKSLSPSARGRLRHLFLARERIARRLDRPTFKVVADDVLLALAVAPPPPGEPLQPRAGLRDQALRRFGRDLVAGLHDAAPIDEEPPKHSGKRRRGGRTLEPAARERYEALREARRLAAEGVGLEPEVTLSNAPLEGLAKHPPASLAELGQHESLQGWRGELLVRPLWRAIAAARPGQAARAPSADVA